MQAYERERVAPATQEPSCSCRDGSPPVRDFRRERGGGGELRRQGLVCCKVGARARGLHQLQAGEVHTPCVASCKPIISHTILTSLRTGTHDRTHRLPTT